VSVKILTSSGSSLADVYDVEGSIAGVGQLDSEEVKTVHEMGATIQSERYSQRIIELASEDTASSSWDVSFGLGRNVTRILWWQILGTFAAQTEDLQLSLTTASPAGVLLDDMPLLSWVLAAGDDATKAIDVLDSGVAVTQFLFVTRDQIGHPVLAAGGNQVGPAMNQLTFRGNTSAFGGGTAIHRALICVGSAEPNVRSRGLPLPSW